MRAKIVLNNFNFEIWKRDMINRKLHWKELPGNMIEFGWEDKSGMYLLLDIIDDVYRYTLGDYNTYKDISMKIKIADTVQRDKKLYCYSHYEFDNLMEENGWYEHPGSNSHHVATISICSPNEDDSEHWFSDNITSNMNLDFDDCGPFWFENHENDCYDKALELYLTGKVEESNRYFNHLYISGPDKKHCTMLHVMNYEEAFKLVKFIDEKINKWHDDIYVHCAAGASRSQGVVRYILDVYNDIDWKTRDSNPCLTPNAHVVMMLKRAYRELFYKDMLIKPVEWDKDAIDEYTKDVKLNIV